MLPFKIPGWQLALLYFIVTSDIHLTLAFLVMSESSGSSFIQVKAMSRKRKADSSGDPSAPITKKMHIEGRRAGHSIASTNALVKMQDKDLEKFSRDVMEIGAISPEVAKSFKSLDPGAPRSLAVRYLLLHAYERLELDPDLHEPWQELLFESNIPHDNYSARDSSDPIHSFHFNGVEYDGYFTERHISALTELLVCQSRKRYDLGLSLNLSENILSEIRYLEHIFGYKGCLSKVLWEWIVARHEHAKPPTVESLKRALRSNIVGLGHMANELEKNLVQLAVCSEIKTDVSSTKKLCSDVAAQKIIRQSCSCSVAEDNSTLLEVKLKATAEQEAIYQWTKEGTPLSEGKHYIGVNKPILCINRAILASEGTYTCEIKFATAFDQLKGIVSKPIALTVDFGPLTTSLMGLYTSPRFKINREWPPVKKDFYINLALVHRVDVSDFARSTVQEDADNIMEKKPKMEFKKAFGEYKTGGFVLIEGRPGSGKTTLVNRICEGWASREPVLEGTKLVFLVSLKLLPKDVKMLDILKFFCDSEHSRQVALDEMENSSGEGVCFILDGLDECIIERGSVLHDLVYGSYLPKAMLIVASRPAASAELRHRADMRTRVEVLGFLKEQINMYIESYPFTNSAQQRSSDDLKSYLAKHPNILHMCYLPVHTAMVTYLYDQDEDLPHTETEVYRLFTKHMYTRSLKYDGLHTTQIRSLESSNEDCFKDVAFQDLCKTAFDMTCSCRQVFRYEDLSQAGRDKPLFFGLVTRDTTAVFSRLYTFAHLTFQEFLAAHYISTLTEEEQLREIINCSGKKHMQVVLKFYCGIHFNCDRANFVEQASKFEKLLQLHDDNLFHCQCAFESQQLGACEKVVCQNNGCGLVFKDHTFHASDFISINFVMENASSCFRKLSVSGCTIEDNIEALAEALKLCPSLQHLDLSNNEIDNVAAKKLALRLEKLKDLQAINLSHNRFGIDGLKAVARSLRGCKKLTTLELFGKSRKFGPYYIKQNGESLQQCLNYKRRNCNLLCFDTMATDADSAKALARSLRHCRNLEALKFQWNGIGNEGIVAVVNALKGNSISSLEFFGSRITGRGLEGITSLLGHCNGLTTLDLGLNSINDNGAKVISESLKPCQFLQKLVLSFNEITSTGAEHLAECLHIFGDLRTLDLKWNEIGYRGTEAIANSLSPSVRTLNLSKNEIGCKGALAIADSLKRWNMQGHAMELRELHLHGNHICWDGAERIAKSLQFCSKLEVLDLGSNHIRNLGMMHISRSLQYCRELRELSLSGNKISEEGVKSLAEGVAHCKTLEVLDVSRNSINDKGAMAFSESLEHIRHCLQRLDLSYNQIGDDGAGALAEGLKLCRSLKQLELNNNSIGDEGAEALAKHLSHCRNVIDLNSNRLSPSSIKALTDIIDLSIVDFSCSNIDNAAMEALDQMECLKSAKSISLQRNKIGDAGAVFLARSLKYCSRLETLYLECNQIGNAGAKALAEGLKNCKNLMVLKLTDNQIGDLGTKALTEGLKECGKLKVLVLEHNQVGGDGVKSLAEGLKHCCNFMVPNLAYNCIGNEGAKYLAEGLTMCPNLEAINLLQNQIGDEGAKYVAKILKSCTKFRQLHLPHNLIGDEGAKDLADGLQCRPNFEDLHLGNNRIGDDGAERLGQSLKYCTSLKTLKLPWNQIRDDGAKSLAKGLKNNSNFRQLVLGHNQIGDNGAEGLAEGLKYCTNFERLFLEHNLIGDSGAQYLAGSLKHFHLLHLGHNQIGDDGTKCLGRGLRENSNLKSLDLGHNRVGDNGARELAEGLGHCSNFKSLNLQHNQIGDMGIIGISKSLTLCYKLEKLYLDHNFVSDEGIKVLAQYLCYYKNLEDISLSANQIGPDGALHLSEAVKMCRSLTSLDLGFNRIGDEGVKNLEDGIRHSSLDVLILDHNEIGDEGSEALARALADYHGLERLSLEYNSIHIKGAQALSECLQKCCDLKALSLKSNVLGSDGVQELAEGLMECSCLQTLNLRHNHIGTDGANGLDDILQYCSSLKTLHLCYNGLSGNGIKTLADGLRFCGLLETLSLDHNKIKDECLTTLAGSLKHCFSLKKLSLEYNKIGNSGAQALAHCLGSCSNLVELNLQANRIGDKGAEALVHGLQYCTHLEVLELKFNEIGSVGAKLLAEGLKLCVKLETLLLEDNVIGEDGAAAFRAARPDYMHIRTLCLDGYSEISEDKGEALLDCIKQCKNRRVCSLKHFNFCPNGANILAAALARCKNLQILKVESSGLDDEAVKILSHGLSNCLSLHTFNLGMNRIRDEGAKALAASLELCPNTRELYLAQNRIGDEGAVALSKCLRSCRDLQKLNLERNCIGDVGARALADRLKHCKKLSLEENNISDGV